jgi:hypothetical protein
MLKKVIQKKENRKSQQKTRKAAKPVKWQERGKKSTEEQEKLKINTKAQNQYSPEINSP